MLGKLAPPADVLFKMNCLFKFYLIDFLFFSFSFLAKLPVQVFEAPSGGLWLIALLLHREFVIKDRKLEIHPF